MSRTDRAARTGRTVRKDRAITTAITVKTGEMKVRAVRILKTIRAVIRMQALVQAAVGILTIVNALREETADRIIDLRKVRVTKTLCPRVPSRTLRSTGTKKNAESVRRKISVPKKI